MNNEENKLSWTRKNMDSSVDEDDDKTHFLDL